MVDLNPRHLPRRRGGFLPRPSVRVLMALVLAIGGGLGILLHQARVQREAVAAIVRAGGTVGYDWQWSNGEYFTETPPWPKWLVGVVGVDLLSNVVVVNGFNGEGRLTDVEMASVGRLPHLEEVVLVDCRVTDAGLTHLTGHSRLKSLDLRIAPGGKGISLVSLEGLARLERLDLHGLPLVDTDLAHLAGLTRLERLDLSQTPITDAGLAHLRDLKDLRSLMLGKCHITSEALSSLAGMSRLEILALDRTGVTTLEPLRPLTGLKRLSLNKAPITDAGLAPLARFTKLEMLGLGDTSIADDGLAHVLGLSSLTHLYLYGTMISDAGLEQIVGHLRLRHIDLRRTPIGDASVPVLSTYSPSEGVRIDGTQISAAGLAELRKARPITY
jgi:Leucine-rich repeat (LRR) protein